MNTVLPTPKSTTPRPLFKIAAVAILAVLVLGATLWLVSQAAVRTNFQAAGINSIIAGADQHERHLAEEIAARAAFALAEQRKGERGPVALPVVLFGLEQHRRGEWAPGTKTNLGSDFIEQRRGEWLAGRTIQ